MVLCSSFPRSPLGTHVSKLCFAIGLVRGIRKRSFQVGIPKRSLGTRILVVSAKLVGREEAPNQVADGRFTAIGAGGEVLGNRFGFSVGGMAAKDGEV